MREPHCVFVHIFSQILPQKEYGVLYGNNTLNKNAIFEEEYPNPLPEYSDQSFSSVSNECRETIRDVMKDLLGQMVKLPHIEEVGVDID